MSDLICRKTMQRCQTPGMCSPHGGCREGSDERPAMASDVKRYQQYAPLTEATDALVRLYPGATQYVLAADHDRIVSSLTEAGRKLQAERDQLRHLLIEAVVELKELKESVGYRAHTIGVIQRIDAALEASR